MKLGWCLTGHHEGRAVKTSRPCPGFVWTMKCSCECHGQTKAVVSPHRRIRRKKGAKVFDTERPAVVTINYEDAVLITKRKIEEYGENYVYDKKGNDGVCVYFSEGEQMKPACIVGQIIDELVEDKELLKNVFLDNGYNPINIGAVINRGIIAVDTEQTTEFLTSLQTRQDDGSTWSSALEYAVSNHPQLQEAS